MNPTKFNIKWCITVKIISFIVSGILLGICVIMTPLLLSSNNYIVLIIKVITIFGFLLVVFSYSPNKLEFTNQGITIHKVIGKVTINYNQISSIFPDYQANWDIRLWGSGGLFGYFGVFKNQEIGKYQAYVGNYKQAFLIQTKEDKNYIISCENKDKAIEIITKNIKI